MKSKTIICSLILLLILSACATSTTEPTQASVATPTQEIIQVSPNLSLKQPRQRRPN